MTKREHDQKILIVALALLALLFGGFALSNATGPTVPPAVEAQIIDGCDRPWHGKTWQGECYKAGKAAWLSGAK